MTSRDYYLSTGVEWALTIYQKFLLPLERMAVRLALPRCRRDQSLVIDFEVALDHVPASLSLQKDVS